MKILAIESLFLSVADLVAASALYERLGLQLSRESDGVRTLAVGGPTNLVEVHLTTDEDRSDLTGLELAVDDLAALNELCERQGIPVSSGGSRAGPFTWLLRRDMHDPRLGDMLGMDLLFRQPARSLAERHAEADRAGLLAHALPLRRLDHLATVAADLDVKTMFWEQTLGIPIHGEVKAATMSIRQMKIGDAILELLGSDDRTAPVWQRPQGLVSMASWEVADLDAVAAQVRQAGFTLTDPAPGLLPGTRIAIIPGAELAGMSMQLLEYVPLRGA